MSTDIRQLISTNIRQALYAANSPTQANPFATIADLGPGLNQWQLNGNSNAALKYIGTNDAFDFPIYTSGTEKIRILTTGELKLGVASTSNGSLIFNNSTNAFTLTLQSGVTSASHTLTLPLAQGVANSFLMNNGAGVLSWNAGSGIFFAQGGNSFGATARLGTNDANALEFETNNTLYGTIGATGLWSIGTVAPVAGARLAVTGAGTTSATYSMRIYNSTPTELFSVRNDGYIFAGSTDALTIGNGAGYVSTLASNIFLGPGVGVSITTGDHNIVIGKRAFESATTADRSIAIGYLALQNAVSTGTNVAIGDTALRLHQEYYCTAVGTSSLSLTTTGRGNSAFGNGSFQNHSTGEWNSGFGHNVMLGHTSGDRNASFGAESGYSNLTGSDNVFLGTYGGYYELGSSKLFIDNAKRGSESDGRLKALVYGVFHGTYTNQRITFNANATVNGRLNETQGADVASANDLTLGLDGNVFEITGTTPINAITIADWQNGSIVTLLFTSTPTVNHNTAGGAGTAVLLLAGAAAFSATAGDTLTLRLSEIGGTQAWRELARTAI